MYSYRCRHMYTPDMILSDKSKYLMCIYICVCVRNMLAMIGVHIRNWSALYQLVHSRQCHGKDVGPQLAYHKSLSILAVLEADDPKF